jgi:hypothetical protein
MRRVSAHRAASFAVVAVTLAALASAAEAQIGRLRRAAGQAAAELPNPARLLEGTPPITTSLSDARWAVDTMDSFTPGSFAPLQSLERTPNGGFVLRAGGFAMQTQSYCLKAGTHGPGGGDGYIFAPPLGPMDDHVMTIVRNSVRHPDIHQHDVQVLLWAIIARAKFDQLPTTMKATAAQLLTPQQLATLNRNALDLIPGPVLDRALQSMPPLVQQVFRAEAQLRQMMQSADSRFEDMERVAVLAGLAPPGEGSRAVPSGRWSLHPDGYYVRYLPSGYSSTRVEVWVPEGSPAVGKEYDPATHIAVPGNTSRQRLIQSGRARAE